MIFVDTSAWFASLVEEEPHFQRLDAWISQPPGLLVTTDYIVDELLTLLKFRGYRKVAVEFGASMLDGSACQLEYVQQADIARAWLLFASARASDWSFTDCVSRVVMQRLNITTACSLDHHFREFGDITVVP